MSDLSLWYERELSWFRRQAGKFAAEHPGLARSLGLSDEAVEDPDVARLVESVALLNARLGQQLNDELPQLTDPLFSILFPHFLRPLPSVGMMQIAPSAGVGSVQSMPAGSRFRAPIDEERYCDVRSCSAIQLLPFSVSQAQVEQVPFSLPAPKPAGNPGAMLRLDLQLCDSSLHFHSIGDLDSLDIYLKGELNLSQRLYDQLFSQIKGLALFNETGQAVRLPKDALQPVFMDSHERILPMAGNTFPGYQLLLEYFAFQSVFLSLRVTGLKGVLSQFSGSRIALAFYLDDMPVELSRSLNAENFQLGCAPVVNLYQRRAEPVRIDHTRLAYPLVIDTRSVNKEQVFSVDSVLDISSLKPKELPGIYGQKYFAHHDADCFWHLQPSGIPGGDSTEHGELSLTDLNLDPFQPTTGDSLSRQLSPRLTCSNGEQALELNVTHALTCLENVALPGKSSLLGKMTAPWQPEYGHRNRWALLAHLQMNLATLLGDDNPTARLQELLSLYNLTGHASQRRCIESMTSVKAETLVAPMKIQGRQCTLQGTDITITLDSARISGVSVMAFVQVLDRLLAGFGGHNSFTRLKVCLKGESGIFYQCPRRQG